MTSLGSASVRAASHAYSMGLEGQRIAQFQSPFQHDLKHSLHQANSKSNGERQKSRLTDSLQKEHSLGPSLQEMDELRAILQNSPPSSSFLGVSPPVRSGNSGGAANPLAHNHNWMGSAYSASHNNLQALRELELPLLSGLTPPSLEGSWVECVPSAIKAKMQRGSKMACRPQSQAVHGMVAEHGSCGM